MLPSPSSISHQIPLGRIPSPHYSPKQIAALRKDSLPRDRTWDTGEVHNLTRPCLRPISLLPRPCSLRLFMVSQRHNQGENALEGGGSDGKKGLDFTCTQRSTPQSFREDRTVRLHKVRKLQARGLCLRVTLPARAPPRVPSFQSFLSVLTLSSYV